MTAEQLDQLIWPPHLIQRKFKITGEQFTYFLQKEILVPDFFNLDGTPYFLHKTLVLFLTKNKSLDRLKKVMASKSVQNSFASHTSDHTHE